MKKTFSLKVENKTPARQVDAIKHEVKKYLTRERKKEIPSGFDFWDFDCRIGDDAKSASKIEVYNINKSIDQKLADENETFYLEILAKLGNKPGSK